MKEESYTITTVPLDGPSLSVLKDKKVLLPETPCDKCWTSNEAECRNKEIACADFVYYINKGIVRDENRIADKDNYLKINPSLKIAEEKKPELVKVETTLNREMKLLNKLRIKSLEIIENYFDDKTSLEKAKVACVVYGLVLKSDIIGLQEKNEI